MDKLDLFIPITYRKESGQISVQLISIKKITQLTDKIPTREILQTHLLIEGKFLKEIEGYIPQPYFLQLEEKEFDEVLNQLKSKLPLKLYELINHNGEFPLVLSSESYPIVSVSKKQNS